MARLTDADYEAGETSENVSSPLSDAGNTDNYYGRRLRTRLISLHARLVTEVPLPEKLATQILLLGLDANSIFLSPLVSVDMVCELGWRSASMSISFPSGNWKITGVL
ncbi:unnamed protein product [Protopolystoma xenopodis]|uniref:Uncharacterized protein n=1 Tax=Protopolystoma xenopodis TaxID=117903 RepID=A0A448WRK8_9PLAT|nr:unnamed protein product [Protopolystoma xenopodis]